MTAMNGPVSPVLERFHRLQRETMGVVQEAGELTAELGPFRAEIDGRLSQVVQAVDSSRLNLVVIGAEGHGKSSFINAATGLDVTPRSEQQPGTVAPVYLEWAAGDAPHFSVVLDDDAGERPCRDRREFDEYLLQDANPDNGKRVIAGWVRFDHPMLRNGLRLVDMPGVEGVSREVSADAARFIAEHAHAVIAVCRDRGYGPLTRVADRLYEHRRLEVSSCVSNWALDFWMVSDDELAEKVARQKDTFARSIGDEGGNLAVDPTEIFVVHLPTMAGSGQVSSPVHEREERALRTRLWDSVQERGVDQVILAATGEAERALLELQSHMSVRGGLLRSLLQGDEDADRIAAEMAAARQDAEAFWQEHTDPGVVVRLAETEWAVLQPQVMEARDAVLDETRRLREPVEQREGRMSKTEARGVYDELNRFMGDRLGAVTAEQEKLQDVILERYLRVANEALERIYLRVPAIRSQLRGDFRLTTEGLLAFTLDRLDEDEIGRLAKTMTAGSLGIAGGMIAGGSAATGIAVLTPVIGNPFGAALAGALGAGVLGWALVDWIRGGQRSNVVRGLRKVEQQASEIDTSLSGELFEGWRQGIEQVVASVDEYVRKRMDALSGAAVDPASDAGTLEAELAAVDRDDARVGQLLDRLTDIGSRAQAGERAPA